MDAPSFTVVATNGVAPTAYECCAEQATLFCPLINRHPRVFIVSVLVGEELEWFSNRSGAMVGTIAKQENVAGWNYAILKRDPKGVSHVRKVMNNSFSLEAARVDLLLSMAGIAINPPGPTVLLTSPSPSGRD